MDTSQKYRCKRCGIIYSHQEVESKTTSCKWHSGEYVIPPNLPGRMAELRKRWNCCQNFESNSSGCCSSDTHEEDKLFTENISRVGSSEVTSEKQPSTPTKHQQKEENPIPIVPLLPGITAEMVAREEEEKAKERARLAALYSERKEAQKAHAIELAGGNSQNIHAVDSSKDTVQGLALHFNVSVEEFMRFNQLRNESELYSRQFVVIPTPIQEEKPSKKENPIEDDGEEQKKHAIEMSRSLINQMISKTKCAKQEAEAYLKLSNWNLEEAIKSFNEDFAFEQQQQKQKQQQ